MSTFQSLDVFYPLALKKKALRRPAYLSLLYKPGRYFFIILAIETPQQARLHEIKMMADLAGLQQKSFAGEGLFPQIFQQIAVQIRR